MYHSCQGCLAVCFLKCHWVFCLVTFSIWFLVLLSLLELVEQQKAIEWQRGIAQVSQGDSKDRIQADDLNYIGQLDLLADTVVSLLKAKAKEQNTGSELDVTIPCNDSHGQACTSNCSRPLSPSAYKRLHDLFMSPKLTLSDAQRQKVLSIADSVPEADIIFLSAASSNHYDEMQAMYHNLHTVVFPHISNYQAVLVDLGLTEKERQMAVLEKARKLTVYTDSSIRWRNHTHLSRAITKAMSRGVLLFRPEGSVRVPVHTLEETFAYLGMEPCAFNGFPELEMGEALFTSEHFIIRTLLEPWVSCALDRACMCPVYPEHVQKCYGKFTTHRCHRFDQSVLTLLSAWVFNKDLPLFLSRLARQSDFGKEDPLEVLRDDIMPQYFSSL